MRRCSHCGKEYADDVTVCLVDKSPVIKPGEIPGNLAAQPKTTRTSFTVKLVSPLSFAGTYRVFVERGDLLFIRIDGGSRSILEAVAPLLGLLGGLIPLGSWLLTRGKAKAKLQHFDESDPEELLRENEKNFKLHLSEIRQAAFEPSAFIAISGKIGRLNLTVRHGEEIKCEFDNAAEMNNAIHWLALLLNSTLRVNVEWNEQRQRFQKRSH
jgi:hypothetical protein